MPGLQPDFAEILQTNLGLIMDWKCISQSKGYKSLKAAYVNDVQTSSSRSKTELLKHFYWVINRAKHYAYIHQCPLEVILSRWEQERSYWWLNYYQDTNQPKYCSTSKQYKKTKSKIKTKEKKRWTMAYKKFKESVS